MDILHCVNYMSNLSTIGIDCSNGIDCSIIVIIIFFAIKYYFRVELELP